MDTNLKAYAEASDDVKLAYAYYVEQCRSNINEYVSEYNFKEWLEAGRPSGK